MRTKNEYQIGEKVLVASREAVSGWVKAEVHSITENGCRLDFGYRKFLNCNQILFFKFESLKKLN